MESKIVLVPKFTDPRKIARMLERNLPHRHYVVHDIFKYLYDRDPKSEDYERKIFLIEWGASIHLIRELFREIGRDHRIFRLINGPRVRYRFQSIELEMSTEMESWYMNITDPERPHSESVRHMVSNYHFPQTPGDELYRSLSNPGVYGRRFHHLPRCGVGRDIPSAINHLTTDDRRKISEMSMGDLGRFYPKLAPTQWSNRTSIAQESPKLFYLLQKFLTNAGKWVIMTSFNHLYGIQTIKYIFEMVIGGIPLSMDLHTSIDEEEQIATRFNNSQYNVLVTSVVPTVDLKGVTDVIVMELSDFNFIYASLKRFHTEMKEIRVQVLSLFRPNADKSEGITHSEIRSKQAFKKLETFEKAYNELVDRSIPVDWKDLFASRQNFEMCSN